jgi:glycine cleavage system H protein
MNHRYSTEHVWAALDNGVALVGITRHAQDTLGDIVFVDLPALGAHFQQNDVAAVVESVKAAADVHIPLAGTVTEVNEALRADPSLANSDPLGAGWFFKITPSQPTQWDALMDEAAYVAFGGS